MNREIWSLPSPRRNCPDICYLPGIIGNGRDAAIIFFFADTGHRRDANHVSNDDIFRGVCRREREIGDRTNEKESQFNTV